MFDWIFGSKDVYRRKKCDEILVEDEKYFVVWRNDRGVYHENIGILQYYWVVRKSDSRIMMTEDRRPPDPQPDFPEIYEKVNGTPSSFATRMMDDFREFHLTRDEEAETVAEEGYHCENCEVEVKRGVLLCPECTEIYSCRSCGTDIWLNAFNKEAELDYSGDLCQNCAENPD